MRALDEHRASRLEFEALMADTSASILAALPRELGSAIEHALGRVRVFFGADRCGLLAVGPDEGDARILFASYADGVSRASPDIKCAEVFPWSYHRLVVEREPVRVSSVEDLPPGAADERAGWLRMPIRSMLAMPIETRGTVGHLILLQTAFEECVWPEQFLPRLRLLGQMLVSGLERQQMMAELQESEAQLALAIDSAEVGPWGLDYRTGTFWATPRARAMFGFSPDAVITVESLTARVHPDDRAQVEQAIQGSPRGLGLVASECRLVLPGDGHVRWIVSRARPHIDPSGRPDRLMGVSVDVTEHRLAQEAVRQSKARLAAGADLAGLAFYEVDFGAKVAYVDDRFRDLCGLPPEREGGLQPLQFWMDHLHPDDRQRVLAQRMLLHDGTVEQLLIEYRYLHPTRGEVWIQHAARIAERDANGQSVRSYGALRDQTERRRTEEELRSLSRRLIRAHEDERALLARELHDDLTQRLAVLAIDIGRAELTTRNTSQAAALRAVREALVRISEDVHTMAYQLHPSVLHELGLAEALGTECERFRRLGRFDVSLDIGGLPPVIGPEEALSLFRVAQESLNNAARHANAGSVNIALRQVGDGLLLTVRDDGVGLDAARQGDGRHLGLASMRERMRIVAGTFQIESAPGQGTTVSACVPVKGGAP